MRSLKYLLALWAVVAFYSLSSVFIGSSGFRAYRELSSEWDKQKSNIMALREKNHELAGLRDALLYDSDTIAVYARDLGFGREDEIFIRIVGFEEKVKQPFAPGEIVLISKPEHTPDRILRIIALYAGMGIIILFLLFDLLRRRPNDRI
ncbi:MAG: septum formation initiator family protein [Spirochaetaceae bacterium]|jgi:cell division protein FtsB|nr:septum formation initiator family protein [Spirochaetaceae bacterium]